MCPPEAVAAARVGNFEVVCRTMSRTKSETPSYISSSVTRMTAPTGNPGSSTRLIQQNIRVPQVKIEEEDSTTGSYSSGRAISASRRPAPARNAAAPTRLIAQNIPVSKTLEGS